MKTYSNWRRGESNLDAYANRANRQECRLLADLCAARAGAHLLSGHRRTARQRGCDFFVGQVRRNDGNQETILAAYAHQEVEGNPVQVLFIEDGQIPVQVSHSLPAPLNDLAGWELPSDAGQQPLYVVYLLVMGYEGNMKLDCR